MREISCSSEVLAFIRGTGLVLTLFVAGCGTSVRCPEDPTEPRRVFLLDHGRHPTLVLSDGQGGLWRYGYGDWRYYARAEIGFFSGLRALVWPTPAALGRQAYRVDDPTAEAVRGAVEVGIVAVYSFEVPGPAVDQLREELDRIFSRGVYERLLVNESYDMKFVPHPRDYWYWYNSNHMVGDWLEQLGCEVSGAGRLSAGITSE